MSVEKVLNFPPIYNELANLLYLYQMSCITTMVVDVGDLKSRIDSLIAYIHANNVIEDYVTLKYDLKTTSKE